MSNESSGAQSQSAASSDAVLFSLIEAVRAILRTLTDVTGLRIAIVARVTPSSWTACAVLDEAGFGLKPGDQLDVATTY